MDIRQITQGPNHHFFGFHDLPITSPVSARWLGLSVARIDRPPMGDDYADVITWSSDGFEPKILTRTRNYNFPQGARQQWLGQSDTVIVNTEGPNGSAAASLYDGSDGTLLGEITESVYCCDRTGEHAFSVDFGRLHRLGGYGHSTILDRSLDNASPSDNGIFVTDIASDQSRLFLSIDAVRSAAKLDVGSTGAHFLTHLRLSPDESRLAFLHRFRLADGGEETCLWTIGLDGQDLRLLVRGFLSHFDWIDNDTLIIWGRRNQALAAIRRNPLLGNSLARFILPLIKKPARALLGRSKSMLQSYLKVADTLDPEITPFAPGSLRMDGHPMLNPKVAGLLLTDTYPDEQGMRELMLYDIDDHRRIDIGRFQKLDEVPSTHVNQDVAVHLDKTVEVRFPVDLYAFTRSGLHCDLHPRWSSDGRIVAFDSIHDGCRQIYAIDVSEHL